jgi:hypothetical protein
MDPEKSGKISRSRVTRSSRVRVEDWTLLLAAHQETWE